MSGIEEVALGYWQIGQWMNNANGPRRAMAIEGMERISHFLAENNVEIMDVTGREYDSGLPVRVIGQNPSWNPDGAVIKKTIKPIILKNGSPISFGEVEVN